MYCEKCGTQLPDAANFCTNCGTSIVTVTKKNTEEKILDTQIQLKVKPAYKFTYLILPSIIIYVIFALMLCLPLAIIIGIAFAFIIFIIGAFFMAIILGIKTIINKKQYDRCCYYFYKTKIIYKDSYLNISEKEVKYKYIREIAMSQTFIQRYFNIGNIYLYTNAETGLGNGISIANVENVQEIYRNIKSIIDI